MMKEKNSTTLKFFSKIRSSIIFKIFTPIVLMIIIQCVIFIYTIIGLGTINDLEKSSYTSFFNNVQNRKKSLEYQMWNKWSDMAYLSNAILESEKIYEEAVQENTSIKINSSLAKNMIDDAKQMDVDGVFVFLENNGSKDSFYARNIKGEDVLIQYGSEDIINSLQYERVYDWQTNMDLSSKNPIISNYQKIQMKISQHPEFTMFDLGKWSSSFRLNANGEEIVTFMIPLIYGYDQSQVYGFLGIDVSMNSLSRYLDYFAFSPLGNSACSLIQATETPDIFHNILTNGEIFGDYRTEKGAKIYDQISQKAIKSNIDDLKEFSTWSEGDKETVVSVSKLNISNPGTPFEWESMYYLVYVDKDDLLRTSNQLKESMTNITLLFLLLGLFTAIIVTLRISGPIKKLSNELLGKTDFSKPISLNRVKINEIDYLIEEIEGLSKDLIHSSLRMLKTMDATNSSIGTIEVDEEKNTVICLGKISQMLDFDIKADGKIILSVESFNKLLNKFIAKSRLYYSEEKEEIEGNIINYLIYETIDEKNNPSYISFRYSDIGNQKFIVVIDETQNIVEKQSLEYDRDYDYLTGILNRRGFRKRIEDLLSSGKIYNGMMVMWDLDNLKRINDSYGHEIGDKYIMEIANKMKNFNIKNSLTSRISGDEFFLFIYNFDDKKKMKDLVVEKHQMMNDTIIDLVEKENIKLSASAGIAYYPENGKTYDELLKLADWAMYQSKDLRRGTINECEK